MGPTPPPRPSPCRECPGSFPFHTRLPLSCSPPEKCMELENFIKASCFLGSWAGGRSWEPWGASGRGAAWPVPDAALGFHRALRAAAKGGEPQVCVRASGVQHGASRNRAQWVGRGSPSADSRHPLSSAAVLGVKYRSVRASTHGCENGWTRGAVPVLWLP